MKFTSEPCLKMVGLFSVIEFNAKQIKEHMLECEMADVDYVESFVKKIREATIKVQTIVDN